jgi:YD repeat-containing protein
MNVRGETTTTTGTRTDGVPVLGTQTRFDGFGRTTHTSDGILSATVEFDTFSNPVTTTLTPNPEPLAGMGVADLGAGVGTPVVASRRFDSRGTSVEKTLSTDTQARSGGRRELDVLGRTLTETDQTGDTTSISYTPDSLVAQITTGYGQTTTNTYDPVTRALTETHTQSPIGDPVHTGFDYDPITKTVTAVFDPKDRPGTEVSYTYDAHGNTLATRYPDGNTITHRYDQHGRKTSSTDITGNTTHLTYDSTGLPPPQCRPARVGKRSPGSATATTTTAASRN